MKKPEIPEELKPTSISFRTAFWIVFAIHAIIGVGFAASPVINAKVKENKKQIEEDKKLLEEPAPVYVGVPEATPVPSPTPVPTPVPVATPKQPSGSDWPHTKQPHVKKVNTLVKEYTVMPGDTFYSIVRKYRLNPIKLQKLNNISDVNKLAAGQRLKFL